MLSPRFMPHTVFYTQSVVRIPVFRRPQSAVRRPQSAVRSPQSAIRHPPSTVRRLQSAVRRPQSVFYTDLNPIRFWTVLLNTNVASSVGMRDDVLLLPKLR